MDPLSISFGIAGLLPLITKVITVAHQYINAVAGAQKMITSLILELGVLQSAISQLEKLLLSEGLSASDIKFDQASVLLSCSTAIEVKLQELLRKLTHESTKKLGRFLWPLTEKEHIKTLGELREFSAWIQFALSVDGCRLLAQTSDNVVAVLAQQLDQFQAVRRLNAKTTELCSAVQKQATVLENEAELDSRNRVLNWMSTADYSARHYLLQRAKAKDTGRWLLESTRFAEWRDGRERSCVLWCKGIQGSGKTILAAIDELRGGLASANTLLAYYYFDYQDHKSQTPLAVVSCILRQLLEQRPELLASAKELYNARSKLEGRQIREYERILQEVVQMSEVTYIVLDALDESEDVKYMLEFIDMLSKINSCRILVASRPHIYEQLPVARSYAQIKIEAHEEDIKRYVLEQCDNSYVHHIADREFVDQLVDKLTQSASGMFLLPVLQLRTVLNEPTIGEMEDKLDQLTDTLSDAFEETLARIRRLPGSRSRLALSALMHLAHAKRLLQAAELSDVLALRPDSPTINAKYRPTAKMIIECCQGLATLDEQTGQLRLAHYAIQEYLVSNSESLFPQFEVKLAFACLDYLLLDDFKPGPLDDDEEIDGCLALYPFLSYASVYWGSHVQPTEANLDVWRKLLIFYTTLPATAIATQVLYYQKGYHEGYYGVEESLSTTPLHHSAANCLARSAHDLLEHIPVNKTTVMGSTPVIRAASNGHVAMVALLLDRGADPRIANWYGDALQCAAESGQCATIRQLVEWGMSPDGETTRRSPLVCALDHDHVHAVEVLLDLGADMQLNDEDAHRTVFLEACRTSCERTVDMMLRRGWVDVQSGYHTVLALRTATLPILRRLISAGMNVNAVDERGHTALWYATQDDDVKAIDVLRKATATPLGST